MNKTVIITPAFNKFEMATKPFLQSLYQYTDENSFDLIIIDNGSTDGTVEYLENFAKEHSNIRLILNKENLGYSKANNQGINLALEGNYKYIGLLNNDILFTPDFRKHGLKTRSLEVRTRIAIVRVPAQIGKTVLLCVGFKNTLLVGNGIAFALQLVLMG